MITQAKILDFMKMLRGWVFGVVERSMLGVLQYCSGDGLSMGTLCLVMVDERFSGTLLWVMVHGRVFGTFFESGALGFFEMIFGNIALGFWDWWSGIQIETLNVLIDNPFTSPFCASIIILWKIVRFFFFWTLGLF
jgi:hypothetical protein